MLTQSRHVTAAMLRNFVANGSLIAAEVLAYGVSTQKSSVYRVPHSGSVELLRGAAHRVPASNGRHRDVTA